ncbi:glycosyltransferase family 4 protein [Anianabacter salinae]|uniref:glycosyltransferase family 4 protein n=1 Tax=Anianabacter salinae TaxID=2851023 RepID=UPI00225E58E7|nr:glycosyltransferase family 4 protein [Anianabacter salinae]MBV0911120.1 glycosyltransferase family 4 protein [Anianabacter salinae]
MKVLVCHPDLRAGGGAEDYVHALGGALRTAGHSVRMLDIHDLSLGAATWIPGLSRLTLMKHALVARAARQIAGTHDLVIFGFGEGPDCPVPRVEIRHAPSLRSLRRDHLDTIGCAGRGPIHRGLKRLNTVLGIVVAGRRRTNPALTITNSDWTLGRAQTCGRVVYPPVRARPVPAIARVPGRIVSLGRLVPNKRHDEAIRIAQDLHRGGIDVTLDIVGRSDAVHLRHLRALTHDMPFVRLLPDADDATRLRALAEATLGLHCYRHEHFGIAAAEMILAGVVPVVFDGGGITELVPDHALRFRCHRGAVTAARRVFTMPDAGRAATLKALQAGHVLERSMRFEAEIIEALAPCLEPAG